MARLIGITGGIGSGKSLVSHLLRSKGMAVYDTDSAARHLMNNDPEIISQLTNIFGSETYADGRLNRQWLATQVFADSSKLATLNSIIHPAVAKDLRAWAEKQPCDYVFVESAILFESGFDHLCFKTINVSAPLETRISRTMERDNADRKSVIRRIENQMDDKERSQRADYTLTNNGSIEETETMLNKIIEQINSLIINQQYV